MLSVYLETTIPSYVAARPSRDLIVAAHQQITDEWWARARTRFKLYVSEAVLAEIRLGDAEYAARRLASVADLEVLAFSEEVSQLIREYSRRLGLSGPASADLPHLAYAVAYRMDYLVTWNCTHLANGHVIKRLSVVNAELGWPTPVILTPEELMTALPEDEP